MRVDGKNAGALNIGLIEALAVPAKGSKFYGYNGAEAQGMKAPGGFGVVVTASGVRSFVLNYRIAGRERRYTIGRCSTWRVPKAIKTTRELRQRIDTLDDRLLDRAPVSERALGRVIPGVEGVYNRHDYLAEKRDALERLDAALDRILHPIANVIELVRA